MTKRITITAGDYVLLSDIPNEQVFDLVKECFGNAGFLSNSVWEDAPEWSAFYAYSEGYLCRTYSCFVMKHNNGCQRQLSLSDIFNSTNGWFEWEGKAIIFIGKHKPLTVNNLSYSTPDTYHNIPPVDTVCEYSLSGGRTWYACKVVSHHNLVLDCPHIETEDCNGLQVVNKNLVMFRPLRTDREKVIDKAFSKLSEFRSAEQVLGELYDAGMLKGI